MRSSRTTISVMITGRFALGRQAGQRLGRTKHDVAHALHVDQDVIVGQFLNKPFELADHFATTFQRLYVTVMGVADGDGQRVGGIGALEIGLRQQGLHHELDLRFVGVAGAGPRSS